MTTLLEDNNQLDMTDSLFFDLDDILATDEKLNAEFLLDAYNLESLDFMSIRLDGQYQKNPNDIQDEIEKFGEQ